MEFKHILHKEKNVMNPTSSMFLKPYAEES